jgi:hypothetical protein
MCLGLSIEVGLDGLGVWHTWGEEKCKEVFDGETRRKENVYKTWA